MESDEANDGAAEDGSPAAGGASVSLSVPASDAAVYRYEATDPVLHFLVDNPLSEYTIRELSRVTSFSHTAVANAVDVLAANGVVDVDPAGNRKHVSINRNRLSKPDDPVVRIPQTEFHEPVAAATARLRDELADVRGILVFGSVARGEADRQSDVDLWVLVQSDRGTNQRRANDVATDLATERFAGDRYEFEPLVESVRSARDAGDELTEILASGITLYDTETLQRFKREVVRDGE